jgi:hypothetical protein
VLALVVITFVLAAVYVVVLAVTLVLVTFHLTRAAGTAVKLADGLEAVDGHTRNLAEYTNAINGALRQLGGGLHAVDDSYGRLLDAAGLKEAPSAEEKVAEVVASEHAGEISQLASGAGGYHPTGE